MNEKLEEFARQHIKDTIVKLPDRPQEVFKLMYARNGGKRSVADALAMAIQAVVDEIPLDKLSHAMNQVDRTLLDITKGISK